ncbi:MAG TPA: RNA-binding protein [Bacteroidales bacterium]|jgi:RNA recognition motif-containing protein|nr:RNA-binding protein [Bacteroidales bacterium]HOL97068.1 RNA-binding protein [Bacteroidales bacterium]HOM35977.1 RNA-binding protein [Bacteroidales bacterium]HPD23409.1 RNA-binding protein [Bacteroidales bacterium]HRS99423.1 RNA-binding protein [Bacteroidales bacterium]
MNLFVANLHPKTRGKDLQALFSQYGTVLSARVIIDKQTGKSKRYGFVEFENDAEAEAAINALNDSDFQGNKIAVKISIPKTEEN